MKHFIAALLLLVLCVGNSFASDIITTTKLFDDEAVASTGSATTTVFNNAGVGGVESILFKGTSAAGTVDVKIEYVICADTACADTGAAADFTDLLDSSNTTCPVSEGLCRVLMPVIGAGTVKFTVTGIGSNNADTTVELWIVTRNLVR